MFSYEFLAASGEKEVVENLYLYKIHAHLGLHPQFNHLQFIVTQHVTGLHHVGGLWD